MSRPQKYFWLSCEYDGPLFELAEIKGAAGVGAYVLALAEIYASKTGRITLNLTLREIMAGDCQMSITEWNDVMRCAALCDLLDEDKLNEGVLELPEFTPHVLRHA